MGERRVALIRGINVGRAKRVAMAELRAGLDDLGYRGVSTLLNSGNAVFTAAGGTARGDEARIEELLTSRLGVSARVVVLTAGELADVVAGNPLASGAPDPSRLLVAVLSDPRERRVLEPLLEQEWGTESIALGERVAYLWCPDGLLSSRLPEAVARLLDDRVTTRNWATVLKIQQRVEASG